MYGIKVLLYALEALLVICALVLVWYENPDCGVITARCLASMFIVMAIFTSKETAQL